jgi:hypothetical protein
VPFAVVVCFELVDVDECQDEPIRRSVCTCDLCFEDDPAHLAPVGPCEVVDVAVRERGSQLLTVAPGALPVAGGTPSVEGSSMTIRRRLLAGLDGRWCAVLEGGEPVMGFGSEVARSAGEVTGFGGVVAAFGGSEASNLRLRACRCCLGSGGACSRTLGACDAALASRLGMSGGSAALVVSIGSRLVEIGGALVLVREHLVTRRIDRIPPRCRLIDVRGCLIKISGALPRAVDQPLRVPHDPPDFVGVHKDCPWLNRPRRGDGEHRGGSMAEILGTERVNERQTAGATRRQKIASVDWMGDPRLGARGYSEDHQAWSSGGTLLDERPSFRLVLRLDAPVDAFPEEDSRGPTAEPNEYRIGSKGQSRSPHAKDVATMVGDAAADSVSTGIPPETPEMNRGEMIRRLDAASKEVLKQLTNGPLGAEERHALARMLIRLLPLVADDLQNQEDRDAAAKLVAHIDRWAVEAQSSGRLDISEAKEKSDPERTQTDGGPDESTWS